MELHSIKKKHGAFHNLLEADGEMIGGSSNRLDMNRCQQVDEGGCQLAALLSLRINWRRQDKHFAKPSATISSSLR